jgi:hypothetical protein
MRALKKYAALLVPAIVTVVCLSAPAQAKDEYSPVPVLEYKVPWWCIIYTGVFLVASLAVAFKNSRRTHLD